MNYCTSGVCVWNYLSRLSFFLLRIKETAKKIICRRLRMKFLWLYANYGAIFCLWGFGLETFPGQPYLQFHIALELGKRCFIPRSSLSPALDCLQCLRCPVSNWKMQREDPGDVNSSKNLTCSLGTKHGNACTNKTCQTFILSPSPNLPAEIIKFNERSRRSLLHETCTPCWKIKKLLLLRQKVHYTAASWSCHSPRIHWLPNIKYVFYF